MCIRDRITPTTQVMRCRQTYLPAIQIQLCSCAAARGSSIGASRAVRFAAGIPPAAVSIASVFAWCCVLPLFRDSGLCVLCPPTLCVLRSSDHSASGGGAGETSPAGAAASSAIILSPGGNARSGGLESSCAAARGTTIETTRAVRFATGITPATVTTTSVFAWCCVLPLFRDSDL